MEQYLLRLIVLSLQAIWFVFRLIFNLGPWLMDHVFAHVLAPLLGHKRLLGMGKGATIPISMVLLGALWGGVFLLFWGGLGAAGLAWWGVIFGAVAGGKAGVEIANALEQARIAALLEEPEAPVPVEAPERRLEHQAGPINPDGFDEPVDGE